MGIRVNTNDASAEVSRAKPRVGIVSVNLVADASAVIAAAHTTSVTPSITEYHVTPVTQIAYIDLVAGIFVDYNGFYKLLADTFSVVDAASLQITKPRADLVTTTENSVYALTKLQTDTLTLADVFSRIAGYNRTFVETVAEADDQSFSVAKVLAELFTTSHTEVFDHQKLLTDGVAMNDGMEANDGFGIALTRGISNVTMVADSRTLSFTGSRVESVAVQDSGSLRSQSYCDFSYFAEDYVGVALTF